MLGSVARWTTRKNHQLWPELVVGVAGRTYLEGELQAKFEFARRAQRVYARSDADPVHEMSSVICAVDATWRPVKQAGQHARRQVEVREVGQVEEAY